MFSNNYFDRLTRSRNAAIYAMIKAQNINGSPAAGGSNVSADNPDGPNPPQPKITTYDMLWDFIHDEQSWNDAYNREDSPLKRYYEAHPEEDLWNKEAGRAVNFNDRWYEGTIDGVSVSCGTMWATETSQKLTIDGKVYYCEIWGYNLDPKTVELFANEALTAPVNKTFEITKVSFSDDCVHCWEGTINASGAKLPWAVVDVKSPYDLSNAEGKIEFQYDGNNFYPWGEEFRSFNGYGIASLPVELGIRAIDPNNQEATDTFDKSTLAVKGYIKA